MRNAWKAWFLIFLSHSATARDRSWHEITFPSAAQVASGFRMPPPEYGMTLWWGWDGPVNEAAIRRDLDTIQGFGFSNVMIEAGYTMDAPYLSSGWFDLIRTAVDEAARRHMRVWVEDEGKYPSGFAGGKFSAERPDLRMQALVVAERFDVESGQTVSRSLPMEVVSAAAFNLADSSTKILDIRNGLLAWTAPQGRWQVVLVRRDFRTSQTRSVNNPTRGKDTNASLMDYLNPDATRQFLVWTHEKYRQAVRSEFGRTFMGFMGDEPDYSIGGIPWSPRLFDTFIGLKGYDVRPRVASFFLPRLTDAARRIRADYWDVWSKLFSEHFFKAQADWCRANEVEYIVHLNKEDRMAELVRSGGDFFRNMRSVDIPGVDAIWSQIWMDQTADYPKYASSAAHLFGKPHAFTESFAAFTIRPDVRQAKWVIDYQLVRGINLVQVMFFPSSAGRSRSDSLVVPGSQSAARPDPSPGTNPGQIRNVFFTSPEFPSVAAYVHRASFLLSQGRPAARIALYVPTTSIWLGDSKADKASVEIARKLLESQRDFDWVDEQALSSDLKLKGGEFVNRSGQGYRAVIVPPITAISKRSVARLQAFTAKGGRAIFVGRLPSLLVEKTFLNASGPADFGWAVLEPSGEWTRRVADALPEPDVVLNPPCPWIKVLHRQWKDADLYFFFNESAERQSQRVVLAGGGKIQQWDPASGRIEVLDDFFAKDGRVSLPLVLEPYETKYVVMHGGR